MKTTQKYKTFIRAYDSLGENIRTFKKFFDDKRLTSQEKIILEAYLLIRDGKNTQAIELIDSLSTEKAPFVQAHFNLVSGIALNNSCRFDLALSRLVKASDFFAQENIPQFHFMSLYNQFVVGLNLHDKVLMTGCIEQMDKIKELGKREIANLYRFKFIYYTHNNQFKDAIGSLTKLETVKDNLSEADICSHILCLFVFHIKQRDINGARKQLQELKKHKKFHLSQNYRFMKFLLNHLENNSPIYFSPNYFDEYPMLKYQLLVISSLSEADIPKAKNAWSELTKINPNHYLKDFEYIGETSLFSLCLEKYQNTTLLSESTIHFDPKSSKSEMIRDIMISAKRPVSKEELFQLVWGHEARDKDDLFKLTREMSRARKKYDLKIKTNHGSYILEDDIAA